ncbi:MAG: esterase family protein, partial [Oscillospiraceae bacterium]|nr:esterase family protein [Oscillospiraceae bacterium]
VIMNINKAAAAVCSAAILMFTASCSEGSMEMSEAAETISEAVSEKSVVSAGNTKEVSYIEKYKDIISEMPSDGIAEKRNGAAYPEFQKYTYYSKTAERDTPVNVLLPSGYSEKKKYPVLYILHGYYDNEDWMARETVHISEMLTNLIADGEAEEMIVVLPYIYCSKDMPYCTGMDLQNSLNYDNFINDLTTDLMPFVESKFSVAKGRENTAVTGFSMGGREALFIGFSHPELFGYVGAVCPAPGLTPVANSPAHPGQMKEADMKFADNSPYILMISSADNDGVVGSFPDSYRNILDSNNTEYISHTMSSTGHDASSVTPHLYNFFRVIFHEK